MIFLYQFARLSFLAICVTLALGACSVEQATDRCTAESMTLDGLIKCVRETHASTRSCEAVERGPTALPLTGRRVLTYGAATKHGGTSRGIVFEGARGMEVRAPINGLVTFSDPWRSYGDLLIIDSCTTVALMAGPLSSDVTAGQAVTAGGIVARLRQTPSDTPIVYLEVREGGTTIDPATIIPEAR